MKTIEIEKFPDGRLDAVNASLYLGLTEKTMAMWRCAGKGPKFIKLGKVFYFQKDLDEWIEQIGTSASTAEAFANGHSGQ